MHVNQVETKCENYAWKKWMKKKKEEKKTATKLF